MVAAELARPWIDEIREVTQCNLDCPIGYGKDALDRLVEKARLRIMALALPGPEEELLLGGLRHLHWQLGQCFALYEPRRHRLEHYASCPLTHMLTLLTRLSTSEARPDDAKLDLNSGVPGRFTRPPRRHSRRQRCQPARVRLGA